jgi:periplasmic protein TonB
MEMIKLLMVRWIGCVVLLFATGGMVHAQTDDVREWQKQISIRLSSNKGFTPKHQSGTVKVGFVIDRSGNLASSWLIETTGIRALDEYALTIVERSQPFPMPPPELKDDQLRMTVPFIFNARPEASRVFDQIDQGEATVAAKMRNICRGC